MVEGADPRAWIHGDETAAAMLSRVLAERPYLLLPPPLHRIPLRAGNVVEIAGPSAAAKSQVLLQAAVHCILPKEWKGVRFGGLEKMVVYFDLDCRFDVLRLAQILKLRITEVLRSTQSAYWKANEGSQKYGAMVEMCSSDDELFLACMQRFLYIRCYSSSEFLAALKKMCRCCQEESEALGVHIHFLMIDSIGAFYWIDRECRTMAVGDDNREILTLQNLAEAVVQEIRKLLQVQPLLVVATKATIFGSGTSSKDAKRAFGKQLVEDITSTRCSSREWEKIWHHEYMPPIWQSFVTHRICLQVSDAFFSDRGCDFPVYTSEWVRPPLSIRDKFSVRDDGIFLIR